MAEMETRALVERETVTPDLNTPEVTCPSCGAAVGDTPAYAQLRVCQACGHHFPESARSCVARLVDPDSFKEHDSDLVSSDPLHFEDETPYRDRLRDLRETTGERDALDQPAIAPARQDHQGGDDERRLEATQRLERRRLLREQPDAEQAERRAAADEPHL